MPGGCDESTAIQVSSLSAISDFRKTGAEVLRPKGLPGGAKARMEPQEVCERFRLPNESEGEHGCLALDPRWGG